MTIHIFRKRNNKVNDFETEVLQRLDSLQSSEARSRQDIRQIIREELKSILDSLNKKGWWQIA